MDESGLRGFALVGCNVSWEMLFETSTSMLFITDYGIVVTGDVFDTYC